MELNDAKSEAFTDDAHEDAARIESVIKLVKETLVTPAGNSVDVGANVGRRFPFTDLFLVSTEVLPATRYGICRIVTAFI